MEKPVVDLEIVLAIVKRGRKILLTVRREPLLNGAHLRNELPGGKPEKGEELFKVAEREVLEETGWVVKAIRKLPLIFTHDWEYPDRIQHTIMHCFECKVVRKSTVKLKIHKDARWYKIDEAYSLNLMPGDKEFIDIVSD